MPSRPARRGLAVDERQVAYVRKLVSASLWIAIALHLASAIVLFILAKIGRCKNRIRIASVIALLLTALRPTLNAYELSRAEQPQDDRPWLSSTRVKTWWSCALALRRWKPA